MRAPPESRFLAEGERLVLWVRRHPIVLLRPALAMLVGIVGASVVGLLTGPEGGNDFVDTLVGIVALVLFARFVWKLWNWSVDRILVSDLRFVEVSGVFTRKVATMPIARVTDLTYRRSIMGRLLGYGDLVLESAGQDQALSTLDHIPRPDDFYRSVTALATATLPEPEHQADSTEPWTGWGNDDDTGPLPRVIV